MAIQVRRGSFEKFDPTRLLPGEWAVVLDSDPTAGDGRAVYCCFAAGDVKRMATLDDMAAEIMNVNDEIIAELTEAVRDASEEEAARVAAELLRVAAENDREDAEAARATAEADRATAEAARAAAETARASVEADRQTAETARDAAEDSREDAEADRIIAEAARAAAEDGRATAESGRADAEASRASAESSRATAEGDRETAEARRVAEFAIMEQRSKGWLRYYCGEGDYDPATRRPTVESPDESTLYYVPAEHPTTDNQWVEWQYDTQGGRWEQQGTTEASVSPITTDQIDAIISGESVASSNVLQATGLAYFRSLLKTTAIGQLWGGDSQ